MASTTIDIELLAGAFGGLWSGAAGAGGVTAGSIGDWPGASAGPGTGAGGVGGTADGGVGGTTGAGGTSPAVGPSGDMLGISSPAAGVLLSEVSDTIGDVSAAGTGSWPGAPVGLSC